MQQYFNVSLQKVVWHTDRTFIGLVLENTMLFHSSKELKQVIHLVCLYFPKNARYVLWENWHDLYFTWSGFGCGSRSVMVYDNHICKCRTIFVLFRYMYLHRDACTLPTTSTNLHSPPSNSLSRNIWLTIFSQQKCSLTILKLFL